MRWYPFTVFYSKKTEIAAELRSEFEDDLTKQLKRQAAAHAAHIHEELEFQSALLTAAKEAELSQNLKALEDEYVAKINNGK